MSRMTFEDVVASYQAIPDLAARLHAQTAIPATGAPGHIYVFRHRPNPARLYRQLAEISDRAGNDRNEPEVSLWRINDVYILHIGDPGTGTATPRLPQPSSEDSFEWIAHTHPKPPRNDSQQMMIGGPTHADDAAMMQYHLSQSVIVVCWNGAVQRVVAFRPEPPDLGQMSSARRNQLLHRLTQD
jgi:hypothetical protein